MARSMRPNSPPTWLAGVISTPSSAYPCSLLRSVRIEMPRMFAACVRLPPQCFKVWRISSRSTSATVRPTRGAGPSVSTSSRSRIWLTPFPERGRPGIDSTTMTAPVRRRSNSSGVGGVRARIRKFDVDLERRDLGAAIDLHLHLVGVDADMTADDGKDFLAQYCDE